ncbi:ubiquitin carboxyl-terminal hydrolase 1 [Petromyzon marinus]|uniref:ubiquitin carboxyl-terminal hydrolase 1 n=1 Tax=Petromyzon marinus TaxID=7757 RepID=UPI003F6F29FB
MPGLLTLHARPVGPAVVAADRSEEPSPRKNRLSLKFSRRREAAPTSQGGEEEAGAAVARSTQEADSASECASDIAAFNEVCDAVARGAEAPPALPFVGLGNLGNTCYLNSVLQVLYHLPEFRVGLKRLNKLSEHEFKTEEKAEAVAPLDVSLLRSLARLMEKMSVLHQESLALAPYENPVTHPSELLDILRDLNPMYLGYLQHDAQELLRCLLGHVQDACASLLKDHGPAPRVAGAAAEGNAASSSSDDENNGNDDDDYDKKRPTRATSNKLATIKEESDARKADEEDDDNGGGGEKEGADDDGFLAEGSDEEGIEGRAGKRKKSTALGGNARKKLRNLRKTRAGAQAEGERASTEDDSVSEKMQGRCSPPKPSKRRRLGASRRVPAPSMLHSQPSILSKFRAIGKIVSGLTFRQSDRKSSGSGSSSGDDQYSSTEASSASGAHAPPGSENNGNGDHSDGIDVKASRRAGGVAQNGKELGCRDNGNGSSDVNSLSADKCCHPLSHDEGSPRTLLPSVETGRHEGCVVGDLFQGELVLRTRCLECECGSERTESFLDVSLPVQDEHEEELEEQEGADGCLLNADSDVLGVSPEPKAGRKSVQWALAQFARAERLVGRDKYFCETCLHHAEAERTLRFGRLPRILTLHLKRFSAIGLCPVVGATKVTAPVLTPRCLSVSEWLVGGPRSRLRAPLYRLTAFITHSGSSAGAGHYTAYVRVGSPRLLGRGGVGPRRALYSAGGPDCSPGRDCYNSGEGGGIEGGGERDGVKTAASLADKCRPVTSVKPGPKNGSGMSEGSRRNASLCAANGAGRGGQREDGRRRRDSLTTQQTAAVKAATVGGQNGGGHKEIAPRMAQAKLPPADRLGACGRERLGEENHGHERKPPLPGAGPLLDKKKNFGRSARTVDFTEVQSAAAAVAAATANSASDRRWGEDGADVDDGVVGAMAGEWEGRWLRFDDAEVNAVSEGEMASLLMPLDNASATPYLLFYRLSSEEDEEEKWEEEETR